MKHTIKRGLAIVAIAPFAVLGVASGAAADTDLTSFTNFNDGDARANCIHDDYNDPRPNSPSDEVEELRVRMDAQLEDDGLGSDANDIQAMQITATDNQGDGTGATGFWEEHAKVESIKLKYYRFDDFTSLTDLGPSVYSRTYTDSARDGKIVNTKDIDNIDMVLGDVRWYSVGQAGGGEEERLRCFAFLG